MILVIDVGTSNVRAAAVNEQGAIVGVKQRSFSPIRPSGSIAEFDASVLGAAAIGVSEDCIAEVGGIEAIGIACQRASTVVWDRQTGTPIGPGIGWQDLRTTGICIMLGSRGIRLAPNQSATKISYLLDNYDASRTRDLCFGTIESWLTWILSGGEAHVSDASNAGVTGLMNPNGTGWDESVCEELKIPRAMLPKIVNSSGIVACASAITGSPPIAGLIGDQQGSMIGQGCLTVGTAKATFGTGAMLDAFVGSNRPNFAVRGDAGTFPIISYQLADTISWGVEAIMLSAGSCLEWLRDGLQLIESVAESDDLAGSVRDSGGVSFIPALGGMGTPLWDFGARGTVVGLSSATTKAEVVRAVLEGIAHRTADLLEAVEADTGEQVLALHVDGGMSINQTFVQLVSNATHRAVLLSSVPDATTLGAAFLAGVGVGTWETLREAATTVTPHSRIEPTRKLDRDRWLDARERSLNTVPAMSALSF